MIGYRNLSQAVGRPVYVLWNLVRRHPHWKPQIVNKRAFFSDEIVAEIKQFYANEGLLTLDEVESEYGLPEAKLRYNRRRYGVPLGRYGGNRHSPRSRSMLYFSREDIETFLRWEAMGRPQVARRVPLEDGERIVFTDGVILFKRSIGNEFEPDVSDAQVYLALAS